VVRLGIRLILEAHSDFSICGEADSAKNALQLARHSKPDLAIVDLSLAAGHGLGLIRELRESVPDLLVLVLSMHDEALFAERAIRAGARGYVMKQEAIDGLVGASGTSSAAASTSASASPSACWSESGPMKPTRAPVSGR
jgi:DNA-binding NarL/FixJ family response regulator